MSDALASWTDGEARPAIVAFVERAVSEVPVEERVAAFDNDGTLVVREAASHPGRLHPPLALGDGPC